MDDDRCRRSSGHSLYALPDSLSSSPAGGEIRGLSYPATGAATDFAAYLVLCAGVFWFIGRYAPPVWQVLAVLLVLCSGPLYFVDALMGPDGPAVALMVLAMCSLQQYLRKLDMRALVFCGIVLAAAILLRYACAAFIGAACLAVLIPVRDSWKTRVRAAFLLGAIACAPLACLLLIESLHGANATDRTLHAHLVTAATLRDGVDSLSWVFLPYGLPFWFRGAALGALAVAAAVMARRPRFGPAVWIPGLFLVAYLFFLLVSISLLDAATPLNERILAPAVALICVLIVMLCYATWRSGTWLMRSGAIALLCLCIVIGSAHARGYLKINGQNRSIAQLKRDYAPLLPALAALPNDAAIYTNVASDIYLITGRHARNLPRNFGYTDLVSLPQREIDEEVQQMRTQLANTGGVVVYKRRPIDKTRSKDVKNFWDAGLLSEAELKERMPQLTEVPGSPGFDLYAIPKSKQ